jgi:hypothetical protein
MLMLVIVAALFFLAAFANVQRFRRGEVEKVAVKTSTPAPRAQ